MKRVRKEEVAFDSWVKPEPLDLCLDCWKTWMAGDGDRDLGAKTMGMLTGNSDGYGNDPAEAQQARDTRIAVATDAMIDSLKRIQIWAVYKMCGIATPWGFPNTDFMTEVAAAREALIAKLKKNTCTAILF